MFEGLRFRHWQVQQREDGIVVLALDRADSSVNALARAVLDELAAIVERLAIEPPAGVLIRSAKPAGFIVGADIREFATYERNGGVLATIRYGQRVLQRLAELPCPTVAAIHGHCMGGGTELALACRHRVASDDARTRIGLPEVMLGIHPGWGGTARLPRLIGALQALALMLTGKTVSATAARGLGLVERVVPVEKLLDAALAVLRQPPSRPLAQRLRAWASNTWIARQLLAPLLRRQTAAKVRAATLPGAVRADRCLAARRQRHPAAPGTRGALGGAAGRDSDRTQPDPRVLPAGAPEGPRCRGRARHPARACRRRRRDGRRHRGMVRAIAAST